VKWERLRIKPIGCHYKPREYPTMHKPYIPISYNLERVETSRDMSMRGVTLLGRIYPSSLITMGKIS
jgi:hypothetical protein